MKQNGYEDILHIDYPFELKHARMAQSERAAQFSPFAALQGHHASILEKQRLTSEKIILDENAKSILNAKILYVLETKPAQKACYMYFCKDLHKEGGTYCSYEGYLKSIDEIKGVLIFEDKKMIPIDDIYEITSDSFPFTF